jgi:intracellular multiplication protein IcmN
MVFAHRSPKVIWGSYPLLDEIAAYINMFRIVNLYVENYVDEDGSNTRNYALAKARARVLGDYLASKTKEARIVVARGYNQKVAKEEGLIRGGVDPSELVISFRNRIV